MARGRGTTATWSDDLRALAQRVAAALPRELAVEVVLTGSVSRGMADEASDIEMLVVTPDSLDLDQCFALAAGAGLDELDTWGTPDAAVRRVSGYREGVALELVWWPLEHAHAQVEAIREGATPSTGDALIHGVPLRTTGLLAAWQDLLSDYPTELASARMEAAALPWGGFAPAGVLTLIRPGDRLVLTEWLVDAAARVVTIVFALNRVWEPTTKRVAARVEPLTLKPTRLAPRITEALTESDPRQALLLMTELQLDAVQLADSGPYVDRARTWLAAAAEILRG